MMGMLDDNIDGKIEKAELKRPDRATCCCKYFDVLDKNHDGVLDEDELAAAQAMMGPRRSAAAARAAGRTRQGRGLQRQRRRQVSRGRLQG